MPPRRICAAGADRFRAGDVQLRGRDISVGGGIIAAAELASERQFFRKCPAGGVRRSAQIRRPVQEVAPPTVLGVNAGMAAARAETRQEALVVEDDPDARRLVASSLRRLGLRVQEAATAGEALALLARTTPDLICLDLRLPDASGFTVCEHVRRTPRLQDVPVLVISALGKPVDRAQAHAAGADYYLTKPFRANALAESVRELLAMSAVGAS